MKNAPPADRKKMTKQQRKAYREEQRELQARQEEREAAAAASATAVEIATAAGLLDDDGVLDLRDCGRPPRQRPRTIDIAVGVLRSGRCTRLLASRHHWGTDDAGRLASAIRGGGCARPLLEIDLEGNALGDGGDGILGPGGGIASLASSLGAGHCPNLEVLNLANTQCGCFGAMRIARSLASGRLRALTRLNLGGANRIKSRGAGPIAAALEAGCCPNLTEIVMGGNPMLSQDFERIAAVATKNREAAEARSAAAVSLRRPKSAMKTARAKTAAKTAVKPAAKGSKVGADASAPPRHAGGGAQVQEQEQDHSFVSTDDVARAVAALRSGRCERLHANAKAPGWGDLEIDRIADAIEEDGGAGCEHLAEIDLRDNNVAGRGLARLAAAARRLPRLRILRLGSNAIDNDAVALHLARAMRAGHFPALVTLDLKYNMGIGDGGAAALAHAAKAGRCPCLREIGLRYTNVSPRLLQALREACTEESIKTAVAAASAVQTKRPKSAMKTAGKKQATGIKLAQEVATRKVADDD